MTKRKSADRLASIAVRLNDAHNLLNSSVRQIEMIMNRNTIYNTRQDVAGLITKANRVAELMHSVLDELNQPKRVKAEE
jgi:hypothetical protein